MIILMSNISRNRRWAVAWILFLFMFAAFPVSAQTRIKVKTEAPEGTTLRIQMQPYGTGEVSGLTAGYYFGEYEVPAGFNGEFEITGEITQLECFRCQITELNIESAPELFILRCYENKIPQLNLSACPKLAVLDCKDNLLTSLDISDCPLLENVDASKNKITQFTSGDADLLTNLNLSENELESIDLSNCPDIEDLRIFKNKLKSLDLSEKAKLAWLYVYSNAIEGEAMDNFVKNISTPTNPSMMYIFDSRDPKDANRCLMTHVQGLAGKNWITYDYSGGVTNGSVVGSFYRGYDYEPEVSSRRVFITTSREPGEKVNFDITKGTGDVFIEGVAESAPYTGNQTFTITSKDIVIKGDVAKLVCSGNDITALSVTDADILTDLDCSNNAITKLDLAGCSALVALKCQNNLISELNVPDSHDINVIECHINRLRAEGMTAFVNSLCERDNDPVLRIIDTKAPEATPEGNVALKSDVTIATGKGWNVIDNINGDRYGMGQKYEGSDPVYHSVTISPAENGSIEVVGEYNLEQVLYGTHLVFKAVPADGYQLGTLKANDVDITATRAFDVTEDVVITATFVDKVLPEEYFTFTRSALGELVVDLGSNDVNVVPDFEGAELLGWNGSGLTLRMLEPTVKIYGDFTTVRMLLCNLEAVDVTNLPSLTELNLALNYLEELDLSGNSELLTLSCELNDLSSLDLTENLKLGYLNCYGNRINGSAMTDMVKSLPTRSATAKGVFIAIDSTLGNDEMNLCTVSDVALAKERYWVTYDLKGGPANMTVYEGYGSVDALEADNAQWNPATGIFTADSQVAVYTVDGVCVLNADRSADLNNLPAGIYIVRTEAGASFKIYKR